MDMARLSRVEKKTETRQRLLAAAEVVFARDGYHAASVDDVCEEAGFSKGALYSNFESKEDLLLALISSRMESHMQSIVEIFGQGGTLGDNIRQVAAFLEKDLLDKRTWCVLYMEFWTHAVREPGLTDKVAEQYEMWRTMTAALIQAQADESGVYFPLPAEELAVGVVALIDGFVLQQVIEPARFTAPQFANLLAVFLAGAGALSEGGHIEVELPFAPAPR